MYFSLKEKLKILKVKNELSQTTPSVANTEGPDLEITKPHNNVKQRLFHHAAFDTFGLFAVLKHHNKTKTFLQPKELTSNKNDKQLSNEISLT